MKRARILQKLAFFIEEDQRKVYGKNYTCNYKENKIIIHRSLPFVFLDGPDIDHKSYDSGSDIKMEKCHSLEITFMPFLSCICKKCTTESRYCQGS